MSGHIEAVRSWLSPGGDRTSLMRTKPATKESGPSARSPHTLTCLLRKGTQDSIRSTLTCPPAALATEREREDVAQRLRGQDRGLKEYSGGERLSLQSEDCQEPCCGLEVASDPGSGGQGGARHRGHQLTRNVMRFARATRKC